MTQGVPVRPYVEDIARTNRLLTRAALILELKKRGYAMGGMDSKISSPLRILREDFGWTVRPQGRRVSVYCAPDVTEEEYLDFCGDHCYGGYSSYNSKPLEEFARRIAFSYALARMLPEWKE